MASSDERAKLLRISRGLDRLNNPCQLCKQRGAISSKTHFAANFGLAFTRTENHLEGYFCGPCIHKKFLLFTFINLIGWFGIVSIIKVPMFLLSNIAEYEFAIRAMLRKRKQRLALIEDLLEKDAQARRNLSSRGS
ncbi:hypothetical protein FXV83_16265 [Bradyrhizobium hipponense]|uniref:Uncharacterized protein n=1 Tax=Bradyrhizobium hipponense TaxID=2605638 RepID=A0A5S4YWW4_9BRAD|nr:hypothetical protein [Bradyrhizobium hipponense]TYO65489.1 hypothetical protein FXV83_16265 [Bradyrhizobium hipponense]